MKKEIAMELGEAMSVKQVARLIGCSAWTVRQKHLQQGLPCFRSGPSGRLTFYRNQVVAWIVQKQNETKGGNCK
jgi:phage terminase Nu1 subunit (DNA packaging protein)